MPTSRVPLVRVPETSKKVTMDIHDVVDIIQQYVTRNGDSISVQTLVRDFEKVFQCEIPYAEYGYRTVNDFLTNIWGISLTCIGGEDYVKCTQRRPTVVSDQPSVPFEDLDTLCVEMKNNLILDGHQSRARTVKIRPAKTYSNNEDSLLQNHSGSESSKCHSAGSANSLNSSSEHLSSNNERYSGSPFSKSPSPHEVPFSGRNRSFHLPLKKSFNEAPSSYKATTFSCQNRNLTSSSVPSKNIYDTNNEYYSENLFIDAPGTHEVAPPSTREGYNLSSQLKPPSNDDYDTNNECYSESSFYEPASQYEFATLSSQNPRNLPLRNSYLNNVCNISKLDSSCYSSFQDFDKFATTTASSDNWKSSEAYKFDPKIWTTNAKPVDDEIIPKVVKLINLKCENSGVRSAVVEIKYLEMYGQTLPKKWLSLLEKSSLVYMENLDSDVMIYPNRWFPTAPTLDALPAVNYPAKGYWNSRVVRFEKSSCIWLRIPDQNYDVRREILLDELNKHYQKPTNASSSQLLNAVNVGELYAVRMNDNWSRCKVLEGDDEQNIVSLLIDEGVLIHSNINKLVALHEKFTNTPPLIVQGSLTGLEKYEDCQYINCRVRNHLLNANVKVKVDSYLKEKISINILIRNEDNSRDIELNRVMMDIIEEELTLPVLEREHFYDVKILSVENTTAMVQVRSPSHELLQTSLQKAKQIIEANDHSRFRLKSLMNLKFNNTLYLARCTDGTWQRIILPLHLFSGSELSALFIDLAEIKTVKFEDIVEISSGFPDTITFIPSQAVKVQLLDIDGATLKYLIGIQKPLVLATIKVLDDQHLVQFCLKLPGSPELKPIASLINFVT